MLLLANLTSLTVYFSYRYKAIPGSTQLVRVKLINWQPSLL